MIWYPFANEHVNNLQNNTRMLHAMGWMVSFSLGENESFYLSPGLNSVCFHFYLDKGLPDAVSHLKKMPDGYYRIIYRLCEYLDIEAIWDYYDRKTELVDYGYYAGYFQVVNGIVYSD